MSENQSMPSEMLAGLLQHLYQEAQAAAQQRDMRRAAAWYTQCLSVLRQLGNNEEFLAIVMFYYGQCLAQLGQRQQAAAFLAASANMQRILGDTEAEADCIYAVGAVISDLREDAQAQLYLAEALRRYWHLRLSDKIATAKAELQAVTARLPANRDSAPDFADINFAIYADRQLLEQGRITADGAVIWLPGSGGNPPVTMGLNHAWQTVCTDIPFTLI